MTVDPLDTGKEHRAETCVGAHLSDGWMADNEPPSVVWIEKVDWNTYVFHLADGSTTEMDYTEMLLFHALTFPPTNDEV